MEQFKEFKDLKDEESSLKARLKLVESKRRKLETEIIEELEKNEVDGVTFKDIGNFQKTESLQCFVPSRSDSIGRKELFKFLEDHYGQDWLYSMLDINFRSFTKLILESQGDLKIYWEGYFKEFKEPTDDDIVHKFEYDGKTIYLPPGNCFTKTLKKIKIKKEG